MWEETGRLPDQPLLAAAAAASGRNDVQVLRNLAGKPLAADGNGCVLPYHITNSHDGGTHLALALPSTGIAGVGVDLVHLPRLRSVRHSQDHMQRLARRVMNDREFGAFTQCVGNLDLHDVQLLFAAHFSLMEAASKALGTGLRLGVGFGRPTSLHPHQLSVVREHGAWGIVPGEEARRCLANIEGCQFECFCGTSENYLASCVVISLKANP